jgi:uncharacterized damage-inducible protein DinB
MTSATVGRPHAERIRYDLNEIRKELTETVERLTPDDLKWVPNPDYKMRTIKDILQEIGAMEAVTLHMVAHGKDLDWPEVMQSLSKDNITELLAEMSEIRNKTLTYLDSVSEEQLETPVPLNEEWQGYFNAAAIEPEELFRWIVRHEYYHLGQIITYQWQRGKIPNTPA